MPEQSITNVDEQIALLSIIELLTLIFRGPNEEGWRGIILSGLPELRSRTPKKTRYLTATLQNLQDSLPAPSEIPGGLALLETEYVRLFVAARGGIAAPLYQSCYLDETPGTMGASATAMRTRLNECGLEVSLDSNEPPDHLAIQLEYLYHLLAHGWSQSNDDCITRAQAFARIEMLPWVRRFCDALITSEAHPAYIEAGDLTLTVLETIC
jgi:TorA-specific chaperone